jgi:hypothetical protein
MSRTFKKVDYAQALDDATSHQLGAVRFPDGDPIHEEGVHTALTPVKIHVKLATPQSCEQSWADVPAPLKREPVVIRDLIAMMRGLAIHGLHEQQLEIIGRSQILRHPALPLGRQKYCKRSSQKLTLRLP